MAATRKRNERYVQKGKRATHTKRAIQPRFVSVAVREPPVRSTDGEIEDQIEGCPGTVLASACLLWPRKKTYAYQMVQLCFR